jgi:uroporphyrinogen decarboxylase
LKTGAPAADSLFLKACRRERVDRTPVWLMRQAGRYMREYREIRARKAFLEICRDSALAAEVTVSAQRAIGADAAIVFADILLLVEAFGLPLEFQKGDGPSIPRRIAAPSDVRALPEAFPEEALGYVLETVRACRRALDPGVPLIGFAGAPFTVASYMIEGGASKDFARTKAFLREEPAAWRELLQKIARATGSYLNAQIAAGADAVQLFDSWAGCLSPEEYRSAALPYSAEAASAVAGRAPLIHFGTGTGAFLEAFSSVGDVIGVDARTGLAEARRRIGPGKAVQGNLDPRALLGGVDDLRREVRRVLDEAGPEPGHIFNLGHGVLPETPEENVVALVAMVKEMSRR